MSSPKARSTHFLRSGACSDVASPERVVRSSEDVAQVAIDQAKVAVVPGEAFGAPGYLRMSYALGDDDIAEGVSRLAKLFATAE